MSYGDGISQTIGCLALIALFGIIGVVGYSVYFVYDKTGVQTFESKSIIKPDYRLETDGKKIDTIYIYRIKD